ncbi:DinB family protein [Flexivirga endophytica]|uniref:DinB family protein n=1 Tax=Flexivirga endophytica TaxID=1849103 RepID=UPI00166358BE|nr:DinB family protein [Flexivirga endophytica]
MADLDRERDELLSWLTAKREHVLAQLDGLSDEQLRRPVLPSGWSCIGLVRHLTLSDERFWFEVVVAGRPLDFWPEGDGADWIVAADESVADVVQAYRDAIAASNAIIAARRLDEPPADPGQAPGDFPDLRSVVVHVLVETATHAGHLDATRELLDGHQRLVLD